MKDVIDFIDEFEIPDFGDIADCFKVLVTESHRIVRVSHHSVISFDKFYIFPTISEPDRTNHWWAH